MEVNPTRPMELLAARPHNTAVFFFCPARPVQFSIDVADEEPERFVSSFGMDSACSRFTMRAERKGPELMPFVSEEQIGPSPARAIKLLVICLPILSKAPLSNCICI